jgi:hypothetical protein
MFGLFKTKKHSQIAKETSDLVIEETQKLVQTLRLDFQHRFEELKTEIKDLNHGLKHLENQLLTKDLRDKQQYGHLHYKIHEVKNNNIEEEIEELEKKLKDKDIV